MSYSKPTHFYIVSNPATPGYVKIGITGAFKTRLLALSMPEPPVTEVYIEHPRADELETHVKRVMQEKNSRGEWYKVSPAEAKAVVVEALEIERTGGEWLRPLRKDGKRMPMSAEQRAYHRQRYATRVARKVRAYKRAKA